MTTFPLHLMTCDLLSDLLSPNIPQPIALYIRDAQRGQSSEVEAEAKFKEAEQNIIFHGENIC